MRITAARVIAISLLYAVAYIAVSIVVAWHHPQGEARGPQEGDYLKTISISSWWVALLVVPPLLLAALWAWQRFGGGRAP
jgi:hypothetical protein